MFDIEVSQGAIVPISLQILSKAATLGDAEALLLGSAPDDAVATLELDDEPPPVTLRVNPMRATPEEWLLSFVQRLRTRVSPTPRPPCDRSGD